MLKGSSQNQESGSTESYKVHVLPVEEINICRGRGDSCLELPTSWAGSSRAAVLGALSCSGVGFASSMSL